MTQTQTQRFLGIMSGTSLDGLDVVLIQRRGPEVLVETGRTYPYPPNLQQKLLRLCAPSDDEIATMMSVDIELGRFIAESIRLFLDEAGLKPGEIRAIGSHGQTIRHLPNGKTPNTLQIGDPNTIAQLTGIATVADFRRRDMAAGGQGAPLVPAFHQAMFQQAGEARVVANIGGIANITILPGDTEQPVTGFDTGPGNVLMDAWYRQHQTGDFDRNGLWASGGVVNEILLQKMMDETFLGKPPPKSTGRELFNLDWLHTKLTGQGIDAQDVQATLCQFTAMTLMQAIRDNAGGTQRLLVCGGGVHNQDLMQRLRTQGPAGMSVESTASYGMDPDCVEGACFAWMASRTLDGASSNLPAVTGARQAVILGGIYPA